MRKNIESNEMFRKAIEGKEELEEYLIEDITITRKDFETEASCVKYNNVIFRNVTFEEIEFDTFLFANCTFVNSIFNKCVIKLTRFLHCDIISTIFENTEFTFSEFTYSKLFCTEYKECNFIADNRFTNCCCTPMGQFFFNQCTFYAPLVMQYSRIPLNSLVSSTQDLKKIIFNRCDSSLSEHLIINLGPIGSRRGYTTYIPHIDWLYCGCWTDDKDNPDPQIFCGGHLDAFEKRVQNVYPKGKYHDQYMAAVQLFKAYRDQYYKKEKENHK